MDLTDLGLWADGPPVEALGTLRDEDPVHTRHRALLTRAFVPNTVKRLEDDVRGRMTRILDRVIEQGECDFVTEVAVPLPVQVIADLLGFPEDSAQRVFDWSLRLAATQDPDARGGGPEESLRALQEIIEYSNEIADMRRREPRDDLLTRLAGAEVDGQAIGREALGSFVLQLIVAGNETTRNALAVGTMVLLEDRDQWRRLVEDREAIPGAVEEILRWSTPVYYMRRTATLDTELGGRQIAEGDKVAQWLVAANRDPALNDDPLRFDVTREGVKHHTFGGGGRRFCLGAGLSRLELRVALEELTERMPELEATGPVRRLRSNFFGGLLSMPVGFAAGARRGPAPSAATA